MSLGCKDAGYVSSGGVAGGLLVLLVCEHMKTNTVKMRDVAAFNLLNNYFVSDSFKTSSFYYMHHDTFSNAFVRFSI